MIARKIPRLRVLYRHFYGMVRAKGSIKTHQLVSTQQKSSREQTKTQFLFFHYKKILKATQVKIKLPCSAMPNWSV